MSAVWESPPVTSAPTSILDWQGDLPRIDVRTGHQGFVGFVRPMRV